VIGEVVPKGEPKCAGQITLNLSVSIQRLGPTYDSHQPLKNNKKMKEELKRNQERYGVGSAMELLA